MSLRNGCVRFSTVIGLVCLVLAGGQAWADDSPWYVATRFGESSAEVQFGSRHAKWVDDEANTMAVDLGYEVNRYLAIEAGYLDLGSHGGWGSVCRQSDEACIERLITFGLCIEGSECSPEVLAAQEAEISGFSLALVPGWPLGERFALRGKLGLIAWDSDVTALGFGVTERFSGEELLTGIGLEYSLPSGLGVLLEHEELDLDASSTSLGLSWRF
jgi:hypothetical protein